MICNCKSFHKMCLKKGKLWWGQKKWFPNHVKKRSFCEKWFVNHLEVIRYIANHFDKVITLAKWFAITPNVIRILRCDTAYFQPWRWLYVDDDQDVAVKDDVEDSDDDNSSTLEVSYIYQICNKNNRCKRIAHECKY